MIASFYQKLQDWLDYREKVDKSYRYYKLKQKNLPKKSLTIVTFHSIRNKIIRIQRLHFHINTTVRGLKNRPLENQFQVQDLNKVIV